MDLDEEDHSYFDGVYLILNAATNIKVLHTRDEMIVKFVLKLLGTREIFEITTSL